MESQLEELLLQNSAAPESLDTLGDAWRTLVEGTPSCTRRCFHRIERSIPMRSLSSFPEQVFQTWNGSNFHSTWNTNYNNDKQKYNSPILNFLSKVRTYDESVFDEINTIIRTAMDNSIVFFLFTAFKSLSKRILFLFLSKEEAKNPKKIIWNPLRAFHCYGQRNFRMRN